MKIHTSDLVLPGLAAVAGVLSLTMWFNTASPLAMAKRIPGLDGSPQDQLSGGAGTGRQEVPVAGVAVRGEGVPGRISGEWPGFRGLQRDGIGHDEVRLARTWPPSGPPVLWRLTVGEGYASAAIRAGCVYLLDYDETAQADTMRCLSLDDGREIWRNSYPVVVTRNHGISRTVPVLLDDCVISFGPRCHVACWGAAAGECRWLTDLVLQFRAREPNWYAGQCPLVDQGRLILAPCGEAMLVAVDSRTGKEIWRSPNPRRWEMTHVSITPMDFAGRRTYVYCGSGGVAGIAAEDGTLLWDTTVWPVQFAHAPSPLVLPGNRILLCSGYASDTGALILQLEQRGDEIVAEVAKRLTPKQFNSEQQTPILYNDHVFGVRKRGGGQLVCLDLEGQEVWNSGSDRFGHGPYLIADGLIFVMDNNGRLAMAEATPAGYKPLSSFQAFEDGHDAWGPMALASGRLILREMTRLVCLDVAAP